MLRPACSECRQDVTSEATKIATIGVKFDTFDGPDCILQFDVG